jgi:hypothetical protein
MKMKSLEDAMTAKIPDPMFTKEQIERLSGVFDGKERFTPNTVLLDREVLRDILTTMRHALLFIKSRQKMHKDGVRLHEEVIRKLERI